MSRIHFTSAVWFHSLAAIFLLMLVSQRAAVGQTDGQADLDEATQLKLNAQSMADLERVIELCDSALQKGLDEDTALLAKSLATATLYQHGSRFAQALFDQQERAQRPAMLKQFALRDFYKALEYDDNLPRVHMMVARLEATNTGEQPKQESLAKGVRSANRAVELLTDDEDKSLLSKALVLRAGYQRGPAQMADLDKAIEADGTNVDAWRTRGLNLLLQGEFLAANGQLEQAKAQREKAMLDFSQLLAQDPNDPSAHQALAELLEKLGDLDEALAHANSAIDLNPQSPGMFRMRSKIMRSKKDYGGAIRDLNRAIDLQPDDFRTFLERADVNYDSGDKDAAATDYAKARELEENLTALILQGVAVRAQGKLEKAIAELGRYVELDDLSAAKAKTKVDINFRRQLSAFQIQNDQPQEAIDTLLKCLEVVAEDPSSKLVLQQLGNTYVLAEQPFKAIETYDKLVSADPTDATSLRGRGDALLSVGEQAKSLADYESAQKLAPEDDGILNNLAWVLATSPVDSLRNGARAIELATKACEVTEYSQAHILSTLAAAYAETGDFENAVKWSTKAVEMDEDKIPQLTEELASYKQGKPWRELQEVHKQKQGEGNQDDGTNSGIEPSGSDSGNGDDAAAEIDVDATVEPDAGKKESDEEPTSESN